MTLLAFIRKNKLDALLAQDFEAFTDWKQAETAEIQRNTPPVSPLIKLVSEIITTSVNHHRSTERIA